MSDRDFTVIGVWENDDPIIVGVVHGVHQVSGGREGYFPEGTWATSVAATDIADAEAKATAAMLASLASDDEDEDEDADDTESPVAADG